MAKHDRLTAFLYLLMRDHVPFGVLAQLITELEANDKTFEFTAKGAGFYAHQLGDRLLTPSKLSTSPQANESSTPSVDNT